MNQALVEIREIITFSELAKRLGLTKGAISHWKNKIPAERVLEIEQITGIHRSRLRPDLFQESHLSHSAPCTDKILEEEIG